MMERRAKNLFFSFKECGVIKYKVGVVDQKLNSTTPHTRQLDSNNCYFPVDLFDYIF